MAEAKVQTKVEYKTVTIKEPIQSEVVVLTLTENEALVVRELLYRSGRSIINRGGALPAFKNADEVYDSIEAIGKELDDIGYGCLRSAKNLNVGGAY